ncbi:MAG TPA: hypothetical protein VFP87_09355 [Chitinophagaceae bacterium]|nr:hypothetical protein [Chitinophagaceae bacterium]
MEKNIALLMCHTVTSHPMNARCYRKNLPGSSVDTARWLYLQIPLLCLYWCIFILMTGIHLSAQSTSDTAKKYPTPEFNDHPLYYDEGRNQLLELERPKIHEKQKRNASSVLTGIGKVNIYILADGEHSPVRIKKKDTIQFMMRLTPGIDPSSAAELTAFTFENKQRTLLVSDVKTFKGSEEVFKKIHFQPQRIREGIYVLRIANISTGEYGIATEAGVFAFGIDE